MTDTNLTHLYFLLDRSGSMQSIKQDTQGGFDAFIEEQRRQPGECRVTLAQFDNEYEQVFADRPIADVPPLRLEPRGTTALLDSIGRLVTSAGERISRLPGAERPGSVVIGIMTDGHENASTEYTHGQVKALIERQTRDHDWQFLYMGADQDAIEVGASIGVDAAHAVTYSRDSVHAVMGATSANVSRYRTARSQGMAGREASLMLDYTDDQREAASD